MKRYSKKSFKKSVYVLGLNEAQGASAAILKDGEIIAAALEERFSRIKNHWGYPKKAISYCLNFAGIKSQYLDLVVLSYIDPYPHFTTKRAQELPDALPPLLRRLRDVSPKLEYKFPLLNSFSDLGRFLYYKLFSSRNQQLQITEIARDLKLSPAKILRINHHLAHAYTTYFANPEKKSPMLVLTCDGAGDKLCASIYIVRDGDFQLFATTPHTHSLGLFYASITSFLGLKAHEDEHKVMGLAPYAKDNNWQAVYKIFNELLWVEGVEFRSAVPARHFDFYLEEKLKRVRFDHIAAAVQNSLEDILIKWIKNAVKMTGVRNLSFAGGVFLNVKANQKIASLKEVESTFFMPSPGDDTNAFGACYNGFIYLQPHKTPLPLTSLYLGPEYSEDEIYKYYSRYKNYKIAKTKQIEKQVAQLLSQGEVVARFVGRMEFGARALGNRSILADPRQRKLVEIINRMIKMRDFWMPFAPTILVEDAQKYLKNPKKISAAYMILAFETTDRGRRDLASAVHPYDKTVRPQVLEKQTNPSYYDLINEFKKLTGVGALVNTSFNLHGEPIVRTPQDALSTFSRSGLNYLQLENFLISKIV